MNALFTPGRVGFFTLFARVVALAGVGCVSLPLSAQTADPNPTASFIQNKGDKSNRVDFFLLGDGYTASEINTTYTSHINNVLDNGYFNTTGGYTGITNPYVRYRNFINIIRVDVKSVDSGIDYYDGSTFTIKNSALSGQQGYPSSSTMFITNSKADAAINTAGAALGYTLADADWKLVFINTANYGGASSGGYPVFSAGWYNAPEVAMHEGGHANHNLADEYSGSGTYTGSEPTRVNVTKDPTGAKWSQWLGYNDPQTGVVGAYEGALGKNFGIYRPSDETLMNLVFGDNVFGPIAREKIILDIYDIVNPMDAFLSTTPTYTLADNLWVDVVDTNVINVQWKFDSTVITDQTSETFDLQQAVSLLGPGVHTITARAYDTILDHNFSDNNNPDPLDLVRSNLDKLEQSVSYTVNIDWLVGDADFDGDVDNDDLVIVTNALGHTTFLGNAAGGDLNGDGFVNQADLDIVTALVPEPTSAMLFAVFLGTVLRGRRKVT